jgi:hypothetical protein
MTPSRGGKRPAEEFGMSLQKWAILIVFAGVCTGQNQEAAAEAGVHFTPGSSVSFDANGKMVKNNETAAYWHGHPGKFYTAAFSEKGTENAKLLVQFQGDIEWTARAITVGSDFAVKATKTSTAAVAWLPVKSFKVDGPALIVVTGDGATLRLYDFDIHFTGKADHVASSAAKPK